MRFEEAEGFKPFKIVVETQEEANYLYALVAGTDSRVDAALDFDSYALYDYLESKVQMQCVPNLKICLECEAPL
jgi:hypothetical protein